MRTPQGISLWQIILESVGGKALQQRSTAEGFPAEDLSISVENPDRGF
jgi:hypothetical protein